MINWYSDEKLAIFFGSTPRVCMRYILPTHTPEEKKSIEKYPFMNKTSLNVELIDNIKERTYGFTIPKGYNFDGASVPRVFWRLIGSNTDNAFLIPALIHDVLCENHHYVMNDREFSTRVFDALLKVSEVSSFKRFLMRTSVNVFQMFCGWGK